MRNVISISVLALCVPLFLASITSAQQSPMDNFLDGVEAYDAGLYEQAETPFQKAIELEPANLEYRYYLGLTYSAMKRYGEALEVFEAIVEEQPEVFRKAFFEIAALHAKQKHYQKAIDTLSRVEEIDPTDARIYLEKGYAFQRLNVYDRAIANFNKAKEINPAMSQLVYYNIGTAHYAAEAFDQAEKLFTRAIELDPTTPIARQGIVNARGAKRALRSWYLSGSFTWGYDDNVLQKALEQAAVVSPTGETLDETDQFQTLNVRMGGRMLNNKKIEAGVGISCFTTVYHDLTDNNVVGLIPHAYIHSRFHPVYVNLHYDWGHYDAGGDEKLRMHALYPVVTLVEPYNLKTEVSCAYQDKDYRDELTSDAKHLSLGVTQHYQIPETHLSPRLGYTYGSDDADEDMFSYSTHQILLGLASALPWDIRGDISLTYEKTGFENNPYYTDEGKRKDTKYILMLSVAKPLSDIFQLSFSYSHTRNDSNVSSGSADPYEFKKNVYGLMITAVF